MNLRDAEDSVLYEKQHKTFDPGGAGGFSRGNLLGAVSPLFPLERHFWLLFVPQQKVTPARQGKVCGEMRFAERADSDLI